ncbi:MAG: hypothetical protein KAY37_03620 [Phycisphaerae bacterium]|nr:hypothetical protein [Phycisphaerae bacterium]
MNANDTLALTTARLRLKRWFLRVLVISLTTCAFVAVIALLLGTFNETTARILLTLGALAVHSGVAMSCSASLERRLWSRLSLFGFFAFGVNFCVLIACIWWPGGLDEPAVRASATTGALLGYYILAIPSAALYERGSWAPLPFLGVVACATGFLMLLVCIWAEPTRDPTFPKATGIVAVIAFSLAHMCLLIRVPGGPALTWILGATSVCIWAVAAMSTAAIIFEPTDDLFYRLFGAVGVMDASGTLSLLIVAKLKQVGKVDKLASTPAQIELRCPRCTASQVLAAGKSKCAACGLKFDIEIEEPRCAKCDYLLWQLPERRCPECGTAF